MNKNPAFQLLIVEDDALSIEAILSFIPNHWKYQVISEWDHFQLPPTLFHAALVDMHLTQDINKTEGPNIIRQISKVSPKTEIIAMSGDLSLDLMEKCLQFGATKFLAKPLVHAEVTSSLEKIEALWQMRQIQSIHGTGPTYRWLGTSKFSEILKRKIASMKGETSPILLEGETGTGKEVACRLLNEQEPHRPLIQVNISSITESLFESEMYGHVRGAFTGADSMKVGLAEAANGGDLFLDEIESMPMNQQVKLLRFLETGEVRKVGAKESIQVKLRVITATNQNLSQLVKEGKFREDLLFRISGQKISLSPLRERTEDIKELSDFFISLHKPRLNKTFTPEAIAALKNYSWPGNVRELKRICEQLALTSPLPFIRAEDVNRLLVSSDQNEPFPLSQATNKDTYRDANKGANIDTAASISEVQNLTHNDLNISDNKSLEASLKTDLCSFSSPQPIDFSKGLDGLLSEYEAFLIKNCFEQEKDIDRVAQLLRISRSSLYKKVRNFNITY